MSEKFRRDGQTKQKKKKRSLLPWYLSKETLKSKSLSLINNLVKKKLDRPSVKQTHMNIGGNFLTKLWCCVGGRV